jgi:dihydroorotase
MLLIKNTRIMDPAQGVDTKSDILIADGKIEKIGSGIKAPAKAEVFDANGAVTAPGFIDMHVHLREPGYEHKATIASELAAAAAGGFVGVACMPNTNPAMDDSSIVRNVIERAAGAMGGLVSVYPIAAVTKERAGKQITEMAELSDMNVVGFSDDGNPVESAEIMRIALEYSKMYGKPIIQHAEEKSMTHGGAMNEGLVSTMLGLPGIPAVAEALMIQRDIMLTEYTGGAYHVAHLSTRMGLDLIRAAKKKGLPVTCEVAPHHFTLTDEEVRSFDTNTKMHPPLRTQDDVDAMKEGLADGTIDAIATDHAPHSFDEKEVEYLYAPFGIVGLETAIGLSVSELVKPGILTLAQMIEKFTTNPRTVLRLPQAVLKEGERACLTVFDPYAEWTVDIKAFISKSKNSPFGGRMLTGRALGVVNNGTHLLQPVAAQPSR